MPKPHTDALGAPDDDYFTEASARLAHNVRRYRSARRLTQEALAELVGCDVRHIQRLESDKVLVNAQLRLLADLARALDVDATALLRAPRRTTRTTGDTR